MKKPFTKKDIETIRKSIKCPLFKYAVLTENNKWEIKRKPFKLFWLTFGKRIVTIKIAKFNVEGLPAYKTH